ncbi:hypothetical protein BGL34_05645 [Fructilactobacillus lindneri]|uniref:HTH tetR-type domain-containing protein n=2 Tax=Fructilactobacillus lindneri TaxID=53444 RepID=A0A0R2JSF4_9LACO|nr:TetR/AcrR family transcriptional regulator [Fructilactobacillus lindneri]ANZ57400.1 hypothetical protein AYR60_00670 [Fructilactobacillus lindneri]ANZ58666.1 hypothetical protein AYR59_00670 [Fructilactobacillus lindneri]KRN80008.1 hypothetical protein IV52_GL000125 [Fructilactobacillus lindneri DSM 20690 = JCM 11027]POG97885.1 hypothetical protein BGL31_05110 [Fructilactobacillus lindneri]POG99217.1 hypothetical protein BGL32_05135 [Fructilactobacillus lindneri]
MPSQTFDNLSHEKQIRIQKALLDEFSHYSLAEAQVARIVKEAKIARGAFYKYFADLTDAYQYEFKMVMREIHRPLKGGQTKLSPNAILTMISDFINESENAHVREFVTLYYQKNRYLLSPSQAELELSGSKWGVSILIHQTIRDILLQPQQQPFFLRRLKENLEKLS